MLLFSLGSAIARALQYRIFIKKDLNEVSLIHLIVQIVTLFLTFLIPGLLLVRWYYRQKDQQETNSPTDENNDKFQRLSKK